MTLSESVSLHASPSLNCVSVRSPAASAESATENCVRKAWVKTWISLKASSRDRASRVVAVTTPVRSKSASPFDVASRVTSAALFRRLSSTWALALVSTTFVASAPAPLTPAPISPMATAIEAAMARARILACSVASSAMSPEVLVTP